MNEKLKGWLSVGMVLLSGLVLILVFGHPASGSRPIAPSFVSMFGWEFGLMFAIFQIGYCYYFNIKKGLLLIIGIWIVIVPGIYLGTAWRWHALTLSGFDRVATGSACSSALAVGIAILKGKL